MSELFDAVDALIASAGPLPPPAERARLRKRHGLSQEQVASALQVRRSTVVSWESGRSEPRPPQREAYARLLSQLAELYPEPERTPVPQQEPASEPEPGPAPRREPEAAPPPPPPPAPAPQAQPAATRATRPEKYAPAKPARQQRPAEPSPADPRFAHGPLAVVDADGGEVSAYCVGGLVLDVPDAPGGSDAPDSPGASLPGLASWALAEARLGAPRLHRHGQEADPLLVLTAAAAEHYGLPARLEGEELRRSLRLPEDHAVVRALAQTGWRLTRRGFGPWARVHLPAEGSRRRCVQFALLSWDALDSRAWGAAAQLPPAELARLLGTYAERVLTPCGSTAVCGLELMTALRPPTRPVRDEGSGEWVPGPVPGSLTEAVECAPCEAPDGHPVLDGRYPRFHRRTPEEVLDEEAYDWSRDLTDEECLQPYVVGVDVNMAFAAAANRLTVGLGAPTHLQGPAFDKALPGSWLVDLSHIALDERLPSPFTPHGRRPEGPAWYATPTVAYAVELGHEVAPLEAYVRRENGPYLDAWYTRLRDAYVATMGELGVVPGMPEEDFLAAMARLGEADQQLVSVLSAIKATVKGGIGKLRERPRGGWRPGQPWPALQRPTWRPDIRAAVISAARVNMHRKMRKLADTAGLYPVAVLSDCAVYASAGPSPLDFLPRTSEGKPLPGGFRLGVSPGMVKHEGTRSVLWAEGLREEHGTDVNIARHVKGDNAADGGE